MHRGCDLSVWNGEPDFFQVKAAGYDFVILKAGGSDYGLYEDRTFKRNYEQARTAGLNVGAYYFAGPLFYGRISGVLDAERMIRIIGKRPMQMPVFVDIEATQPGRRAEATEAAIGFCETMEAAGYFVGIYASDISGFHDRLEHEKLTRWAHWVADYSGDTDVCKDWQIRQITSRGSVPGIRNYVDLDITQIDYPLIIKKKKLNNHKGGKTK